MKIFERELIVQCGNWGYRILRYRDSALMVCERDNPLFIGQYVTSCTDSELRRLLPGITIRLDEPTVLWSVHIDPVPGACPEIGKRMVFSYRIPSAEAYWISPVAGKIEGNWPG